MKLKDFSKEEQAEIHAFRAHLKTLKQVDCINKTAYRYLDTNNLIAIIKRRNNTEK